MKIVKLENGNIQVINNSSRIIKSFTPSGASLEFTQGGEAVGLFYAGSNVFDFYPEEVESTQVLPAAKVAFSGDEEDLLDLLSTSFFFDEVGEAGGEGSEYITEYFYKVDLDNFSGYPYLIHTEEIPLDNAISFEVDYIGFRTDTIGIGKRQTLAKYAANDGGVISVANTVNTLTSSNYGITASIVQNVNNLELQVDIAGGFVSYNFWIKIRKINK